MPIKSSTTIDANISTPHSVYRPEIDGLRALAVIAVIVNHFHKSFLPSGYLGVDIFFVISGYVITASLANRPSPSFNQLVLGFYSRRIKRLVPALIFCIGVTGLLICLFNPSPGVSLQTGMFALVGLSNVYLLNQATDYFGASAEFNAFTHTWSLGVEEQFYLIYPILVWLTGFGRQTLKGGRNLIGVMSFLTLASLIGFSHLTMTNPSTAYFLMPTRFWELGVGCLLYLGLTDKNNSFSKIFQSVYPLPVLILIVFALFIPTNLGIQATITVVGLTSILIASIRPQTSAYLLFTHPYLVYIGLISYSLYLWHWSILTLSRWTIGIHWWSIPFQIGLMFLLALVSYQYIEKPLRQGGWPSQPWKSIATGMSLFSCGWGVLLLLNLHHLKLFTGKGYTPLATPILEDYPACNFSESPHKLQMPTECGMTVGSRTPTVYMLGDSHMGQFINSISAWAEDKQLATLGMVGNFCQFPPVQRLSHIELNSPCYLPQSKILAMVLGTAKEGDFVFIGNALYAAFSGHWDESTYKIYANSKDMPISLDSALNQYMRALELFSTQLAQRGVNVIVYLDSAQFKELNGIEAAICRKQWFNLVSDACQIRKRIFLARRLPIENALKRIVQKSNHIYLWDGIHPTTCAEEICSAEHFFDSNHFNGGYPEFLFQEFQSQHPALFQTK